MIPIILFNLIEIVCTIVFGILLGATPITIAILLITWTLTRMIVKSPMHYKNPIKCFIMTLLMFISLFLATKVHLLIGILCVVFDNIVLSQHGNINDVFKDAANNMFQWNNFGDRRKSAFHDLVVYIANNSNDPILLEYEKHWRKHYSLRFEIYELFFKKRMTHNQIVRKMKLADNSLVKKECHNIYSALEIPLNLKPLNEQRQKAVN